MTSPDARSGDWASESEEGFERQIGFNRKAIIETTRVVVLKIVFIQRPGELAANLPDERLETILESVFFHLPQDADLLRIGLEV